MLACYSPADYADYAEECSKLHYLAEKDRLVIVVIVVIVALGFGVCLRHLRDLREIYCGFICAILTEYACVFVSRRLRRSRRENAASCIISQRKTGCWGVRLFCCFGVCQRKSARSAGDIGV